MNSNTALFQLINAGPDAYPTTVLLAELAATGLVPLAALIGVILWIHGDYLRRGDLLAAALATALSLVLNQLAGMLWFEPRPFMVGIGHTFLSHVPDNSFPSDHASFLLSMGLALIAGGTSRGWGALVLVFGGLTAWARLYLGVHFPIDMLGSAVVASAAGLVTTLLRPVLIAWPLDLIERIYTGTLDLLRLPHRLFPRGDARSR